jgi:hypothetical protein
MLSAYHVAGRSSTRNVGGAMKAAGDLQSPAALLVLLSLKLEDKWREALPPNRILELLVYDLCVRLDIT